jgi:hypothetical protein
MPVKSRHRQAYLLWNYPCMTRIFASCMFIVLTWMCTQYAQGADFGIALKLMLPKEGGYVNSKKVRGGETYCGITRKTHPDWEGWRVIDKHKMKYGRTLPELDGSVEAFYREHYWNAINGDDIKDQKVANSFFYMAVKRGIIRAIRIREKSVGMRPTGASSNELTERINRSEPHLSARSN